MSRKTSVAVPSGLVFKNLSIRSTRPLRFRSPVRGSVSAMTLSRLRWENMIISAAKVTVSSTTNSAPMMLAARLSLLILQPLFGATSSFQVHSPFRNVAYTY